MDGLHAVRDSDGRNYGGSFQFRVDGCGVGLQNFFFLRFLLPSNVTRSRKGKEA
jgi:hypothetical protein